MKNAVLHLALALLPLIAAADEPFGICIVDEETGRGVPLVELVLENTVRYISDSAGWVAFNGPGLMNEKVFFGVRSHGYEFPKDGLGFPGKELKAVPGKSATLKIRRINIAERLCRLTGGGINFDYFTDKTGFSRPMFSIKKSFPVMVWVGGLTVVPDAEGTERLVSHYSVMKSLGDCVENGFAVFNDSTKAFDPVAQLPIDNRKHFSGSHPVRIEEKDSSWILFNGPWPVVRAPARLDALCSPARHEAFTRLNNEDKVDRDADGKIVWGWKSDTGPVSQAEEKELIAAGLLKPDEARFHLADAVTEEEVLMHAGSVRWNNFRKRWVLIGHQKGGSSSHLGEVWYAEADAPTGPWHRAVKIVTHNKYSFYNVVHHDFPDSSDGRCIHFEGTYTMSFSGTKRPTSWYDYNQIFYRRI
jgi:hypothetical protein